MLERDDMLAPQMVERLQQHRPLDLAHDLRPESAASWRRSSAALISRSWSSASPMPSSAAQSASGRSRSKTFFIASFKALDVPLLGVGLLRDVLGDQVVDDLVAHSSV